MKKRHQHQHRLYAHAKRGTSKCCYMSTSCRRINVPGTVAETVFSVLLVCSCH